MGASEDGHVEASDDVAADDALLENRAGVDALRAERRGCGGGEHTLLQIAVVRAAVDEESLAHESPRSFAVVVCEIREG